MDWTWAGRSRARECEGPATGLPVLRGIFPAVARSELKLILSNQRAAWRDKNTLITEELEWTMAGTVWASDFTDPPIPIDGLYPSVLATRDLASHMQLQAQPTIHADAATSAAALAEQFALAGAPLVLKTDNGSPFIAEDFRKLLDDWGVILLLSPAWTPRYNGSVEAGMGSLKAGTFYQAAQNGHGSHWTSDDLDAAREQANRTLRPWPAPPGGPSGPTPLERWQSRPPITIEQRQEFGRATVDARRAVMAANGLEDESLEQLSRALRASLAREGIRRAMESLGYLVVRRRRISPPINSSLRDIIR